MKKHHYIVILVSLLFSSCITIERTVEQVHSFEISGMMHHATHGGGCWQFIGDDGDTYEITGIKVISLLKEGLHAQLLVRGPIDVGSVCEVDQVVEIVEIIKTYIE